MAGPATRERRRPEERVVRVAEGALQDMASTAPRIGGREALEQALTIERQRAAEARSAADVMRERILGATPRRTAPEPGARPAEATTLIATLRTRIREVREHNVGVREIDERNERATRELERRLDATEAQIREGRMDEAARTFHGIQNTLRVMAEATAELIALRREGASPIMSAATDAAVDHALAGETRRADLQIRIARAVTVRAGVFRRDEALRREVEAQAAEVADRNRRMDEAELARREGLVGGIEQRAAEANIRIRRDFADSLEEQREVLMQTAQQVSQDMQDKMTEMTEDMNAMVTALRGDRAAEITDQQMAIMARRVLAYREAAEALSDENTPQSVRRQMEPVYLSALGAMRQARESGQEGRMQDAEALMMAAGEIGRHPGTRRGSSDIAYREDLARLSSDLSSAQPAAREAARAALVRRMTESVSAELRTRAGAVSDQTVTIANGVITPMQQHPEQVTLEQLRVARAMVYSLTRMGGSLDTIRRMGEEDRNSVISVFNRGLSAMAQGNFQAAEIQMSLANSYIQSDTTAQQRTEIRSLSQMLEQNPAAVQTVQQYMDLNNRIVELRRGMRGLAGEERRIAETTVLQLEQARRRLSETGSVATEEQATAQLAQMRRRFDSGAAEDAEFRSQVTQLAQRTRREGESEADATARVLQILARGEAERLEQERITALGQLGTSFTSALSGKSGQLRRNITEIFTGALNALIPTEGNLFGNLRDAEQFRRAGETYAALRDQRDRQDLLSVVRAATGATREPGARIFDERQMRVIAVYQNWAERGQSITDTALMRNASAYRSLALMAARSGNRQEFQLVMDYYTAYVSLAAVPESQLTAETDVRARRTAALRGIEQAMGTYSWTGGRRLEDIGAERGGWTPREGRLTLQTSPIAFALTRRPPGSVTDALAEGQTIAPNLTGDALAQARAEAGGRRIAELSGQAEGYHRLVVEVRFEQRAHDAVGARTAAQERAAEGRYDREAQRLTGLATQARRRGNEVLAQYYEQQAGRVDRSFVHGSVGSARTIFQRGQRLLDEAVTLGREADSAREAPLERARARVTELLPQLAEDERQVVSQIIQNQGTDVAVMRRLYANTLRLLAQRKLEEGNTLMEDADRIIGGVGRYDRSVRRVDTRRRESGRRELVRGITVLIAVDSGRDVTLTGDPVPGAGAPSPQRAALLRTHGRSQVTLGDRAVAQQERIQTVRNRGIAQARTQIRDRNITAITGTIRRMLERTQPGQTQMIEETLRARFEAELQEIERNTGYSDEVRAQRLQNLYERVAQAAQVGTRTTPVWPMGGQGELLYDANGRYQDYRAVVGLYSAERFDAAQSRMGDARAAIREGQMLAGNRVTERRLRLDLIDARGGPNSDFMLEHNSRQLGLTSGTDMVMTNPVTHRMYLTPELLNEVASHLPADQRTRFRERIQAAGTDSVQLINILNDLEDITVPVPGRPGVSRRVMDTVLSDGLMYYDGDGFERRILSARDARREGRGRDASSQLDAIGQDMQIDSEIQRRDISRVRHSYESWRTLSESGQASGRVLLQPAGTISEPERQRQREEREDTNAVLRQGLQGIETSIARSAGYHEGAAQAAENARDEMRRTRRMMDTTGVAQSLVGVLTSLESGDLRQYPPWLREGLQGRMSEYRRLANALLQAQSRDPNGREAAQAAAELYGYLRQNHYDMSVAIEYAQGHRADFPGAASIIDENQAGITADQASARAFDWGAQEARARQIAEEGLYIARDELQRANHAETRRYLSQNQRYYATQRLLGWSPRGGEYRLAPAHRDRAADAMMLVTAITEQRYAIRAYDILVRNERIEGPGFYFRGEQRAEGYGGGRLVLGDSNVASRDAQGNATTLHGWSFGLADQLGTLIVGRRMEVASYLDEDAMPGSNERMRAMAEMEIDDTFLRLGVRRTWDSIDENTGRVQASLYRWSPASQEEADAVQRASVQFRQLIGRMDSVITSQADPSLLLGSWIGAEEGRFVERVYERAEQAFNSLRTSTMRPRDESVQDRTYRLGQARREYDASVPITEGQDSDARTQQALRDIGTWASYQRWAGIGIDVLVIAGTAIFAPEFLPAVFIGMGARGAAEGYEMRVQAGEWTGEAKFAFGMGVAGMVLVPLSEAAQVMRGAAILRAMGGETGILAASRTTMLAEEGMQLGFRGAQLTRFMGAGAEARALMAEAATALQQGRTVMYAGSELAAGGEAATQFFGTVSRGQRIAQYFTGAPGLTLFQRGTHIAGLGMMGVGSAHYLTQLPAQIRAYMRADEEVRRGGTNIVTLGEILTGLHASVLQNVGQAMYAIRASGAVGPSEAYIPRYQQVLIAAAFGVPMQPRAEHVMARDHHQAQQEYMRMPETDRTAFTEFTTRHRLQLDPAAQAEILRDYNTARSEWSSAHPGEQLTFDRYMSDQSRSGARRLYEGAFESRYQSFRDGEIRASDLTPAMRAYAEARQRGAEPAAAVAQALTAPRAAPTPTPVRPPEPARPGTAARLRGRAAEIALERQAAQERQAARAGLESQFSSRGTSQGPDGRPVTRYTIGRGERAIEISQVHAEAAMDLAYHAERIARAPDSERAGLISQVPENLRAQAQLLAQDSAFRATIFTPEGQPRATPERAEQLRLSLEAAGSIPEIGTRPEVQSARIEMQANRMINQADIAASDLTQFAQRWRQRAADLRAEGSETSVRLAAAWERAAQRVEAEAARRAPPPQPAQGEGTMTPRAERTPVPPPEPEPQMQPQRRGPPPLPNGIRREGQALAHEDIPGRTFTSDQVERAGRIRALAEGGPIPADAPVADLIAAARVMERAERLARGLRERGQSGEVSQRQRMRMALEISTAEAGTRTPAGLLAQAESLTTLASSLRGSGRAQEAAAVEREVVALRRQAREMSQAERPRARADGLSRDGENFRHEDIPDRTFTREEYGRARRALRLAEAESMSTRASAADRELALRIRSDPRFAGANPRERARIALERAVEPPRAQAVDEARVHTQTRVFIEGIAEPSERAAMAAEVQRLGADRVERILRNLSTIRDAPTRMAAVDSFAQLLRRSAAESSLHSDRRHIQRFLAGAQESEILLIVQDRRINPADMPSEHFAILNRDIPIADGEAFRGLLDQVRAIPTDSHRDLITGLLALRGFRAVRARMGAVARDGQGRLPRVTTLENSRYPQEMIDAIAFLRRFGIDPRVHQDFPWGSRDLMRRSSLYHRVEQFGRTFESQLSRAFPGQEETVRTLMRDIMESVTVQDVNDTNLPFTPHGWQHSLDVLDIGRQIFHSSPLLRERLIRQFGTEERALAALDLATLLHDIGYGGLAPAANKGAHPMISGSMFLSEFSPRIARLFGIDVEAARTRIQADQAAAVARDPSVAARQPRWQQRMVMENPMLRDIYNAILLHGADKPDPSARPAYRSASDTENPLLFITRLADNMDMTISRMRDIQTDPVMLEALREMYTAGNEVREQNPRGATETKDAYNDRIRPILQARLEAIRERYRVTPEMESMLAEGVERPTGMQLPRFAEGRSYDDARIFSQLLDQLNDSTWSHFVGCQRVVGYNIREVTGTDGRPRMIIDVEIAGRADAGRTTEGVDGALYQIFRAAAARNSLFYGREIPADHVNPQGRIEHHHDTGIDINYVSVSRVVLGGEGERPGGVVMRRDTTQRFMLRPEEARVELHDRAMERAIASERGRSSRLNEGEVYVRAEVYREAYERGANLSDADIIRLRLSRDDVEFIRSLHERREARVARPEDARRAEDLVARMIVRRVVVQMEAEARTPALLERRMGGTPLERAPALEMNLSAQPEAVQRTARTIYTLAEGSLPLERIPQEFRAAIAEIRRIRGELNRIEADGRAITERAALPGADRAAIARERRELAIRRESVPELNLTVVQQAREIATQRGTRELEPALAGLPPELRADARMLYNLTRGLDLTQAQARRFGGRPEWLDAEIGRTMQNGELPSVRDILAMARRMNPELSQRATADQIATDLPLAQQAAREVPYGSVIRSGRTVIAGSDYGTGVRASNDIWFNQTGRIVRRVADSEYDGALTSVLGHIRSGTPPERIPAGEGEVLQTNALLGNGNSDERGIIIVTRRPRDLRGATQGVRRWVEAETAAGRPPTAEAIEQRVRSTLMEQGPMIETHVIAIDKSGLGDIDRTTSWYLDAQGRRVTITPGRDAASVISRELFGDMMYRASDVLNALASQRMREVASGRRSAREPLITEADINAAMLQVQQEVMGSRRVPDRLVDSIADARDSLRAQDIAEREAAAREGRGFRPQSQQQERTAVTEALRRRLGREPSEDQINEVLQNLHTPDPRTYRTQVGPDPARAGAPRTISLEAYAQEYLGRGNQLLAGFAHGTVSDQVRPGRPDSADFGRMYERAEGRSASYTHPISDTLGIQTTLPAQFVDPVRIARERLTALQSQERTAARAAVPPREPRPVSEEQRAAVFREVAQERGVDAAQLRRWTESVVTGVDEHEIPRMERSARLAQGSRVGEVRFRLTEEGRQGVEQGLIGHVRAAAAGAERSERIAGLRHEFGVNEAEAGRLLDLLDSNTLTMEAFFDLIPRKGVLFARGEWGFSEGNTALGHYGMNALAQSVSDAVLFIRQRAPGVTFADDSLSVYFPPGTSRQVVDAFYARVQANMEARGIRGVRVAGADAVAEVATPTTLGNMRASMTAAQLGVDPRAVEPLTYIVHGTQMTRRDRLYDAVFGERGRGVMTAIDASEGASVAESRDARVRWASTQSGQAREDFLLASGLEEIRSTRSLRRPRDVLSVFAERAQRARRESQAASESGDQVGAMRHRREAEYWEGTGAALRNYALRNGQDFIIRYHQAGGTRGGPRGGGGGPGPRDESGVRLREGAPPVRETGTGGTQARAEDLAGAVLRGESVTVPAAMRDSFGYEVARQQGITSDTLALARFARDIVRGDATATRIFNSIPSGHPVRVALESLVNSRRFQRNVAQFDTNIGTAQARGPGWAQVETARGAILREGEPYFAAQRARAAEAGRPPVMEPQPLRPQLRVVPGGAAEGPTMIRAGEPIVAMAGDRRGSPPRGPTPSPRGTGGGEVPLGGAVPVPRRRESQPSPTHGLEQAQIQRLGVEYAGMSEPDTAGRTFALFRYRGETIAVPENLRGADAQRFIERAIIRNHEGLERVLATQSQPANPQVGAVAQERGASTRVLGTMTALDQLAEVGRPQASRRPLADVPPEYRDAVARVRQAYDQAPSDAQRLRAAADESHRQASSIHSSRDQRMITSSAQARDLVALVEGRLAREPRAGERLVAEGLRGSIEFQQAMARGDREAAFRIAEGYAQMADAAERIVAPPALVAAERARIRAEYDSDPRLRQAIDQTAAQRGVSVDEHIGFIARNNVIIQEANRIARTAQFESALTGRSVSVSGGRSVETVTYGGARTGLPETRYTREQFNRAVSAATDAERVISGEMRLDQVPAERRAAVERLLRDGSFIEETRRAARSGDRRMQLGMALERERINDVFMRYADEQQRAGITDPVDLRAMQFVSERLSAGRSLEDTLGEAAGISFDARRLAALTGTSARPGFEQLMNDVITNAVARGGISREAAAFEAVARIRSDARALSRLSAPTAPLDRLGVEVATGLAAERTAGRAVAAPDMADFQYAALVRARVAEMGNDILPGNNRGVMAGGPDGIDVHVEAREPGVSYRARISGDRIRIVGATTETAFGRASMPGEPMHDAFVRYLNSVMTLELAFGEVQRQVARGNLGEAARLANTVTLAPRPGGPPPVPVAGMDSPTIITTLTTASSATSQRQRAFRSFAGMDRVQQDALVADLHAQGRHLEAQQLVELQAMNGSRGARIEQQFGLRPGTLSDIYITAPNITEARMRLAQTLGITLDTLPWAGTPLAQRDWVSSSHRHLDHLAQDGMLFGMLTSGDMMGAVAELYPGGRIQSVAFQNGLVGAYRVRVIDANGQSHTLFVKRQDLRPDRNGAEYSRAAGIAAADVMIARGDGSALQYMTPDGRTSRYGILTNIADFQGPLRMGGRDVQVRTLSATSLGDIIRNPDLMRQLMDNPDVFWRELGSTLAGSYATGIYDRHEGNIWAMRMELVNPSAQDLAALGYRLATDANGARRLERIPGTTETARLEIDAQGRITTFRIGGIDTDSGGTFLAQRSGTGFDLGGMNQRFGWEDMHRLFTNLARSRNYQERIRAQAEGRPPRYVGVMELVQQAFGTGGNGPLMQGIQRWMGEFGTNTQFQAEMRARFASHTGDTCGMGQPLAPAMVAQLAGDGITYFGGSFNGEPNTPVSFMDGRSVFRDRYQIIETGTWQADGTFRQWPQPILDLFPQNTEVYIVPLAGLPQARIDTITGSTPYINFGSNPPLAIFTSRSQIPSDLAARASPAIRHGTALRAAGGLREAGASAYEMGATPVFDYILGDPARLGTQFGEVYRQMMTRERNEAAAIGPGGDPAARQRYLQERLPDTAAADQGQWPTFVRNF